MLRLVLGLCLACVAFAHLKGSNTKKWPPGRKVDWEFGSSVELTDTNWSEKLDEFKDKPIFIMFFAPWDGFGKKFAPKWRRFAAKTNVPDSESEFVVAHINVNDNADLVALFRVTDYPLFKMAHDGKTYSYNLNDKSEDSLFEFGSGGWKTAPEETLERPLTAPVVDSIEAAQGLLVNHTLGAATILGGGAIGGFSVGFLFSKVLFGCTSSRSKTSKKKKKN